jgi:hypothetical protein
MPQHHRERYPAKASGFWPVTFLLSCRKSHRERRYWTGPCRENGIFAALYVARLDGTRLVDFAANNLHIVQYSVPMDAVVSREELRRHIHVLAKVMRRPPDSPARLMHSAP